MGQATEKDVSIGLAVYNGQQPSGWLRPTEPVEARFANHQTLGHRQPYPTVFDHIDREPSFTGCEIAVDLDLRRSALGAHRVGDRECVAAGHRRDAIRLR